MFLTHLHTHHGQLQDHAPTVPFAVIRRVIEEDLGRPLEQLFASFEERPLAAASLAQVHRAVTVGGERVAVKVQFPQLRHEFEGDMFVHEVVLHAAELMFRGFRFVWMHDEGVSSRLARIV